MAIGKGKGSMLMAAVLGTGLATDLGTVATAQATDAAERPIKLVSEVDGTTVLIRVVGESDTAFTADYTLEIASGAAGNSNRTVQRGSAKLLADTPVLLLSTRLAATRPGAGARSCRYPARRCRTRWKGRRRTALLRRRTVRKGVTDATSPNRCGLKQVDCTLIRSC